MGLPGTLGAFLLFMCHSESCRLLSNCISLENDQLVHRILLILLLGKSTRLQHQCTCDGAHKLYREIVFGTAALINAIRTEDCMKQA